MNLWSSEILVMAKAMVAIPGLTPVFDIKKRKNQSRFLQNFEDIYHFEFT